MRAAFEQGRLGRATPMTPLHLYHAAHDKYPAIADVDKLVEMYRDAGVDVAYRRFRFGGHMTAVFMGVPGALRFLSERFDATRALADGSRAMPRRLALGRLPRPLRAARRVRSSAASPGCSRDWTDGSRAPGDRRSEAGSPATFPRSS
jgi:hypothetical protein